MGENNRWEVSKNQIKIKKGGVIYEEKRIYIN